jgi:hypothetical protein
MTVSFMHLDLQVEFKMLLITQQFFSTLNVGDSKALDEIAIELLRLEKWFSSNKNVNSDEDLQEILQKLRKELDDCDRHLPVASLRRYFEQFGSPEPENLELLLKFYLSKLNKTAKDRDKVDLIVTRWGKQLTTDNGLEVKSIPDLLDKLISVYKQLRLPLELMDGEVAAISTLQNERVVLLNIKSLRELIDKQALLRIRKIKDELGVLFFQPTILVEIVEVNLSLYNIFQKLLVAEQPRIVPTQEPKKKSINQTGALSTNNQLVYGEVKNIKNASLLIALEEIAQSLSTLTLQVQTLVEELRNCNKDA